MRRWDALLLLVSVGLAGCGGGGAGSGGPGSGSPATPDFSLLIYPSAITVNAGSSQTLTVGVGPTGGFSSSVSISVTGLPAGVIASPAMFSLSGTSTQVVTLIASAGATPVSNASILVSGTSGSLSHATTASLTILGAPSFTLGLSQTSLAINRGASQSLQVSVLPVNGFSGAVTLSVTGLPSGVTVSPMSQTVYANNSNSLQFSASSTALGTATVTITGTSGSLTASQTLSVSVGTTPDFSLQSGIYTGTGVTAGSSETLSFGATSYNGFASAIQVTILGLPQGVTASPSVFSLMPGSFQSVVFAADLYALVETTAVVTLQGVSGTITHSTQFSFSVSAPYLSVSMQPSSLTVPAGASASSYLQVLGVGSGNTGSISVAISGLPAGVTANPSSINGPTGTASQNIYFTASSGAVGETGTVTFKATYGPYTANTTLLLTVGTPGTATPVTVRSKSKYIRTDATAGYGGFPPPNLSVFHAPTGRFFASDFGLGTVSVIDSTTEKLVSKIPVPGAFGMDLAPDNSVLYVGTFSGDIYEIDPVQLTVTKRYPYSSISPYGYMANAVYALSNGKLLLMRYFLVPDYSYVDGNGPVAMWNPADNSIVKFLPANSQDGQMPEAASCFGSFEFGLLTNNRTRFLMTPVLTSTGSSILCSLDPNAGTFVYSPTLSSSGNSSLSTLAVSPDGNTVAAYDGTHVYLLDAATLALKSSFSSGVGQGLFSYPSLVIGSDNKTLFLGGADNNAHIYVYDMTTGLQTGWLPAVQLHSDFSGTPILQAMSSNGLIAGVMDEGVSLTDTTAINPMPVGTAFGASSAGVAYGPVGGGTTTSWMQSSAYLSTPARLGSIYFGSNAATNTSVSSSEMLYATSPAGAAGPVDLITVTPDGGEQLLPEAFSYGPSIVEAPTNFATAEGGGPATVYGYGFGPSYHPNSASPISPPADLQVQVGGRSATVTSFIPDLYYSLGALAIPFPMTGAAYTVPVGVAGTSADITLTNATGTNTLKGALTYLPAVKSFSSSGSTLIDGIYDAKRDVYYFTDTAVVRVFSKARGQWLTPIAIPAGGATPQLYGIALSPDGSKLAVADFGNVAVYVINPDNPATAQSFFLSSKIFYGARTECPTGIAITNAGQVYLANSDEAGDGAPFLTHLDTTTGTLSIVGGQFGDYLQSLSPFERNGRLPLSADGSRLYFDNAGQVGYVLTAADTIVYSVGISAFDEGGYGSYEAVLAPNQTRAFADEFLTDSQTSVLGIVSANDREAADANYVYGATLSPDGGLLFVPGTQFIDLYDGRMGSFQGRVSLPVKLSANYRALVSDGKDDVLVAITGSGDGIAVIDLSQIQEPVPVPYLEPAPIGANSRVSQETIEAKSMATGGSSSAGAYTLLRHSPTRSKLRKMPVSRFDNHGWPLNR